MAIVSNDNLKKCETTLSIVGMIEGKIVKRKKRRGGVVLTFQCNSRAFAKQDVATIFCFIGAEIKVTGKEIEGIFIIDDLILLKCAPDPTAVDIVLKAFYDNNQQVLLTSLGNAMTQEEADRIHNLNGRGRRVEIAKIVRCLDGVEPERKPRQREPKTNKTDLALLDQLMAEGSSPLRSWKLYELVEHERYDDRSSLQRPRNLKLLNLPSQNAALISSRGHMTRCDYIHGKKQPQVEWMISRMQDISQAPRHIVDVGGGRGDLATGCAATFNSTFVTIVDKNSISLQAGRAYSAQVPDVSTRMTFIEADFLFFMENTEKFLAAHLPKVDFVVGLHACGDLSDLALEFARRMNASFVICPCCYNKRVVSEYVPQWHEILGNNVATIQRIAESEIRSESVRAMKIINSLRLHSYWDQSSLQRLERIIQMESYPQEYSLRNIVLIGNMQN